MYVPAHFAEADRGVLLGLIRDFPLATLVIAGADGLKSQSPPLTSPRRDGTLVLCGHLARATRPGARWTRRPRPLAVFAGPSAYVTPALVPGKAEHGMVVPTYNYAAVHAYGRIRLVSEGGGATPPRHTPDPPFPKRAGPALGRRRRPADYLDKMLAAIVGVEFSVTRLVGKTRRARTAAGADREGVRRGLAAGDAGERRAAALIPARAERLSGPAAGGPIGPRPGPVPRHNSARGRGQWGAGRAKRMVRTSPIHSSWKPLSE